MAALDDKGSRYPTLPPVFVARPQPAKNHPDACASDEALVPEGRVSAAAIVDLTTTAVRHSDQYLHIPVLPPLVVHPSIRAQAMRQ